MTWHADDLMLAAYAAGDLDEARAFSLETHLLACPVCRSECARFTDASRAESAWTQIVDHIDRPRLRWLERLLLRAGVPEHIARVIGATKSLQASWLLSVGAALAFAVVAAHAGERGSFGFLVTAPLIPLAGIAAAYGRGIDPTYEVGLAAPMRSFRLLLIRAVAVLATSMTLAGVASLALPRLDWTTVAWLLPSLALALTGLALATVVQPLVAVGGVALTWVALAVGFERASGTELAAFRTSGQIVCVTVGAVAALVLAARRERFELERTE